MYFLEYPTLLLYFLYHYPLSLHPPVSFYNHPLHAPDMTASLSATSRPPQIPLPSIPSRTPHYLITLTSVSRVMFNHTAVIVGSDV